MTTYTHIVPGPAGVRRGAISSPSEFELTARRSRLGCDRAARLVPGGRRGDSGQGGRPGYVGERVREREGGACDERPPAQDDGVEPGDLCVPTDREREGSRAQRKQDERPKFGEEAQADESVGTSGRVREPDEKGRRKSKRAAIESGTGGVDMLPRHASLLIGGVRVLLQDPAERTRLDQRFSGGQVGLDRTGELELELGRSCPVRPDHGNEEERDDDRKDQGQGHNPSGLCRQRRVRSHEQEDVRGPENDREKHDEAPR